MAERDTETYIKEHISRVRNHIETFVQLLMVRALNHDKTKLEEPELSLWKAMDKEPRYPYGSDEYKDKVKRYEPVFSHHYKYNRHHPEHYEFGVCEMTLVDLVEMLSDWLGYKDYMTITEAVTVCDQQMERYNMSEELRQILFNTLYRYFSLLGGFDKSLPEISATNTPVGILEEISPIPKGPYIDDKSKNGLLVDITV